MSVGDMTLVVPAGAFAAPTRIAIVVVTGLPDFDGSPALASLTIDARDAATGEPVSFGSPAALVVSTAGWNLSGTEPANLKVAQISAGAWTILTTAHTPGTLTASIESAGVYGVVAQMPLTQTKVTIAQTSNAPTAGRHRIDPGSRLTVRIALTPATKLSDGRLVEALPAGWAVDDDSGGANDTSVGTITWTLKSVIGGATVTRTIELTAPDVPLPDGSLVLPATFSARFEEAGGKTDGPDLNVLVAPRVAIEHRTLAQVAGPRLEPVYLPVDASILDEQRFEVFRIRFEVHNADSVAISWTPQLEFLPPGGTNFAVVPGPDNVDKIPFYAAPEWIPAAGPGGGTVIGPDGEPIEATSLVGDERSQALESPVAGHHSMGVNPAPSMDLPALSFTAIEFSVRATVDAEYLTGYDFRVTDASRPLAGAVTALVRLGPAPPVELSPGQRDGIPAEGGGADSVSRTLVTVVPRYGLVAGAGGQSLSIAAAPDPPHGPYSLTTDACAICHKAHTAPGVNVLDRAAPEYSLCLSCHAGTGGIADVKTGYDATPTNAPDDRAYYRHDQTAVAGHTSAEAGEFAGTNNRHNECTDCHSPHRADSTGSVQETDGWTAPGAVVGASGVTVANGAAGIAPAYGLASSITLEYQLCLKCHSGFTTLPSNAGKPPSRHELDKGIEFNPANLSYHPIEAAGTNSTAAMAESLAGTSPFKQWNFLTTSTIRCLNCHADSQKFDKSLPSAGTVAVAAGSRLPVHASANRGILIQPYKDRVLKGPIEAYSAADFALCFVCHSEAPFVDTTGKVRTDTNFRYHGVHVSGENLIEHGSSATNIDIAGDGGGLATCSECHFRIHSTAFSVNGQASGPRLVNFAPNVEARSVGPISWQEKTTTDGTCTLKCHGQPHTKSY